MPAFRQVEDPPSFRKGALQSENHLYRQIALPSFRFAFGVKQRVRKTRSPLWNGFAFEDHEAGGLFVEVVAFAGFERLEDGALEGHGFEAGGGLGLNAAGEDTGAAVDREGQKRRGRDEAGAIEADGSTGA